MLQRFYAPSQVQVYLNGVHIENAHMIQYGIQDEKTPVYAYNDYTYRSVYRGRTVVQGVLSVYYSYQGYLFTVMNTPESKIPVEVFENPVLAKYFTTTPLFQDLKMLTASNIKEAYANTKDPKMRKLLAAELEKIYFGFRGLRDKAKQTNQRSKLSEAYNEQLKKREATSRPSDSNVPAMITLSFGGPEHYSRATWEVTPFGPERQYEIPTKRIVGVHFTGETMIVRSEVPEDGNPLLELYPFIAKDIDSGVGRK